MTLRDPREPRLPKEYTKALKSTEGVLEVIRVPIYIGTLIRLTQEQSRGHKTHEQERAR